ncbi:redoxin domain-containing protein [Streptomyces sp. NPDC048295]|uniref:peroxiredoxin family protein n=1 Tax=Streptomyces sp. NPDC048295 TaxID=3154617 RepID=UPI00341D7559
MEARSHGPHPEDRSYSDGLTDLGAAGSAVWGISPPRRHSHEKFARSRGLYMPLLSDTGLTVAKSFGITAPLIGVRRAVFILTGTGRPHWKHVTAVGATYPPATALAAQLARLTA